MLHLVGQEDFGVGAAAERKSWRRVTFLQGDVSFVTVDEASPDRLVISPLGNPRGRGHLGPSLLKKPLDGSVSDPNTACAQLLMQLLRCQIRLREDASKNPFPLAV
jgi:hypothetical protein